MIRILSSTLILLLASVLIVTAQDKKEEWRYEGPRVGIDLSRFLLPVMQSASRTGWELQGDIPLKGNFFPTVELGMQNYDDHRDKYRYTNSGAYGRVGIDMNITKFESLRDHDLVFIGIRYGYARFKQQGSDIQVTNYWGSIDNALPSSNQGAHWAELVFGMKGEIMNNLFLGWSLRAKFPIKVGQSESIKPYIVPGIGKTSMDVPYDFSFGIYYRFPIFKTKKLPPPLKVGSSKHPSTDNNDQSGGQMNGGGGMGGGSLRGLRGGM